MLGTVLGTVVALFIALVRYDNEQNLVPVLTELKIPMRVNRTYRIPDGVKARNKEGLRERGEKATATHSCTLAWRITGTGSLVGCRLWGPTESDTTEAT